MEFRINKQNIGLFSINLGNYQYEMCQTKIMSCFIQSLDEVY